MSDKCQVYKLNANLSLKGSVQSVEKGPPFIYNPHASSYILPAFLVITPSSLYMLSVLVFLTVVLHFT